jgi:hypothetical protein
MHVALVLATAVTLSPTTATDAAQPPITHITGRVVQQRSHWEGGLIVTDSLVRAASGSELSVRHLGGAVDGVAQVAFGEDDLGAGVGERVSLDLVQKGVTWFVAPRGEHAHAEKAEGSTTTSGTGFVRAMTDINKTCGTGNPIALSWPDSEAHYVLDSDAPDGVSRSDAEAAVRASFDAWANVGCSYLDLSFDGQVDHPEVGYRAGQDNENVVTYVEHDWKGKSSTQAITLLTFGCLDGVILDADVVVNADDFDFTTHPGEDHEKRRDLQNVLTHEAGHFVGFAHSPDPTSTMFATVTADETQKRDLTDSDVAGMCQAYPLDRGPLDAKVGGLAGCSIGGGIAHGASARGTWAFALLAIFAALGLKSRVRRPNR